VIDMLLQKCINCGEMYGAKEEEENHNRPAEIRGITSGFCGFCWMLWIDQKKYRKLGFIPVADYLRKILKAREKVR